MDDIARLRTHFDDGSLLHPLGSAGTVALGRAIASIAGAPAPADTQADEIHAMIGDAEHLVFVLVDGLGMNLLERYDEGAFLRDHIARELRAVYPSSTAPALPSLATGAWPGMHGATGWWTYIPKIGRTVTLLPFVDRIDEAAAETHGLTADDAFPLTPVLATATRHVVSVMPKWIAGSTYSRYTAAAHPVDAYGTPAEAMDIVAARVGSAKGPTYTYVYTPIIDTAEHEHGASSWQTRRALAEASREIERLAGTARAGTRIVVSADHGQMEPSPRDRVVWTRGDAITRLLRVAPSCEPRCPAFHCIDGAQAEFAAMFREDHGEQFALLSIDDAEAEHLFAPDQIAEEARARLGDFIAVALGDAVLLYEPVADLMAMKGFHGGMTPDEMRIPLIVI